MSIKPTEVYLSRFPFSDLTSDKKRPVLIISKEKFNQKNDRCIVCMISTNEEAEYCSIITDEDLEYGRLYGGRSAIHYSDLFTADTTLFEKKIFKIKTEKFEKIRKKIADLI